MAKQPRNSATAKLKEQADAEVLPPMPALIRQGELMNEEAIDARLSKMTIEQLQEKLGEAERQVSVYKAAIDEKREAAIQEKLDQLKALGWEPPSTTARAVGGGQTGGGTKKRQMSEKTKAKMKASQQARWEKIRAAGPTRVGNG